MNRYINVSEDAVRGIFKKLNHKNIYPKVSDEIILRNYLDEFPTADVQEVIHGEWIDVNGDGSLLECGNCHEGSCCKGNYCSNCGAKMDGEI